MITTDTDAQLLAAVAAGGVAALEPLVARHHVAVHRFVGRRGHRERDLRACVPSCLLGIATNVLRGHARREAAMYRACARTGVDPAGASAEEQARVDGGHGRVLAGALAQMRVEHRDVLLLHALADLSHEEIGRALDVPVGTVKGWLHRARAVAERHLAVAGVVPDNQDTEGIA